MLITYADLQMIIVKNLFCDSQFNKFLNNISRVGRLERHFGKTMSMERFVVIE